VQLQQVLLNLVVNAIQAMSAVHDRPRVLTIRCQTQSGDDGILVPVEDSGTGVDAGASERIFESLFTTKPDGMGMGLSISRSIAAAHGGKIWASPAERCGAVFQIALPSKRSAGAIQVGTVR
jgi:C4-dicarboxylate-specific signal transduction histidine kinase